MSGQVHLYAIDGQTGIWTPHGIWQPNSCTVEAGVVSLRALLAQDPKYVLNTMYIEYENMDDPEDAVAVDGIDKSVGLDYYLDLDASDSKDFLRVPLNGGPRFSVGAGYEELLRDGHYNRGIVYAQSSGVEGVHGKDFTAPANSKIYGIALVCAPEWGDHTKDIVYARAYYTAGNQMVKVASKETGVGYDVTFNHDSE